MKLIFIVCLLFFFHLFRVGHFLIGPLIRNTYPCYKDWPELHSGLKIEASALTPEPAGAQSDYGDVG